MTIQDTTKKSINNNETLFALKNYTMMRKGTETLSHCKSKNNTKKYNYIR